MTNTLPSPPRRKWSGRVNPLSNSPEAVMRKATAKLLLHILWTTHSVPLLETTSKSCATFSWAATTSRRSLICFFHFGRSPAIRTEGVSLGFRNYLNAFFLELGTRLSKKQQILINIMIVSSFISFIGNHQNHWQERRTRNFPLKANNAQFTYRLANTRRIISLIFSAYGLRCARHWGGDYEDIDESGIERKRRWDEGKGKKDRGRKKRWCL
jgi:hypothetical protein